MSYGSAASAFTLYSCKSINAGPNKLNLEVAEIVSKNPRAPSFGYKVTISKDTAAGVNTISSYNMLPHLTETNGQITVNSFSSTGAELKVITDNPFLVQVQGGGGGDYYELPFPPKTKCPEHSRAPCDLDLGKIPSFPALPIKPGPKKITTVAVLVDNTKNTTITFQCND